MDKLRYNESEGYAAECGSQDALHHTSPDPALWAGGSLPLTEAFKTAYMRAYLETLERIENANEQD